MARFDRGHLADGNPYFLHELAVAWMYYGEHATVPASVTIPAGEASATFLITGVNDGLHRAGV